MFNESYCTKNTGFVYIAFNYYFKLVAERKYAL